MVRLKCETCSGNLIREGNYLVCESCHNRYVVDVADDARAVERANAWESLRKSDFEKATELFEEIVLKDKNDHEALWGLALAKASVVYVTDLENGKKVPTLNNITENSFIEDSTVKKAIALAPKEIAESYKKHAEYIEKVRVEWLKTASKEPPYDVFISFKDSDRENGIERTQDSIDAQDIYTGLVQKGYNVFFSRVTLRGKIAEQYEPYIYNAIKTAKVMIVFGEKAEYFNSTWIKNEWTRFKKRIEKGEKYKNSLVVVYKGMNPYDIPSSLLGGKQAIDYGIPSNYELLMNHVKLIVEESNRVKGLDKIEIKHGQMGKKSSEIKTETLQTREIGASSIEINMSDKQEINIALKYMESGDFDSADSLLNNVLLRSPNNAKAKWYKLNIKYSSTDKQLARKIKEFNNSDYILIKDVLNTADEKLATSILKFFYANLGSLTDKVAKKVLTEILPYNFKNRTQYIQKAFDLAISKAWFESFKILLKTLNSNQVDEYIDYISKYIQSHDLSVDNHRKNANWCLDKILEVDEGNEYALISRCQIELFEENTQNAITAFETCLKYSSDINETIYFFIDWLANDALNETGFDFIKHILRYHTGTFVDQNEINCYCDVLCKAAYAALASSYFNFAQDLCTIALNNDNDHADAYWLTCLAKIKVENENNIPESDIDITTIPEFNKYLTLVDNNRLSKCMQHAKKQKEAIALRQQELKSKAQLEEIIKANRREDTISKFASVAFGVVFFAMIGLFLINFIFGAETAWTDYFGPVANFFVGIFDFFTGNESVPPFNVTSDISWWWLIGEALIGMVAGTVCIVLHFEDCDENSFILTVIFAAINVVLMLIIPAYYSYIFYILSIYLVIDCVIILREAYSGFFDTELDNSSQWITRILYVAIIIAVLILA